MKTRGKEIRIDSHLATLYLHQLTLVGVGDGRRYA